MFSLAVAHAVASSKRMEWNDTHQHRGAFPLSQIRDMVSSAVQAVVMDSN